MAKNRRLLGVDLARGVAAYGVVVIHSLGNEPRSVATESFVGLFHGFSVPYFLAASLFLTVGKLLDSGTRGFLRGRVHRLLIPYLIWTAVYVVVRSLLYTLSGRVDDLRALWGDPLSILLLGKSSAPLYFVPLLFVGELIAVGLVAALDERLRRPAFILPMLALGLAAGWVDEWRHLPGPQGQSLSPWERVAWGEVGFAAWCLPYLAGAILFQQRSVRRALDSIPLKLVPVLVAGLLGVDLLGMVPAVEQWFPHTVRELVIAFGALAVAIGVSPAVPERRWVEGLSMCTFGIFLTHPLVIELFELLIHRAGPSGRLVVTPPVIAAFAAAALVVTWGLVRLTIGVPVLARYLYGVKGPPAAQ